MIDDENELEEGATGATAEDSEDTEDLDTEEDEEELGTGETGASEEETAEYTITGLVDIFDEQGNITGQYPVGSVQKLTAQRGEVAVSTGNATKVE